jgi:SWI/SNF-related matrix-associated actin-dependent regulator of chromatin subfamily A member 5
VELWGLLHWLYPSIFTAASEHLFKQSFALERGEYTLPILEACGNLLSKIMIRRTKAVVATNVPPRDELTVFIPLTEAQRFWYYRLLTRIDTMNLNEIFDVQLDECEGNEGRKEIQSHLASQIEQDAEGGNNSTRCSVIST